METMGGWFGLKDDHRDFMIETDSDARLFFARHDLADQLRAILRRSFRTGTPPKMVLYGDWGVGKTHTMRHMEYDIENNEAFNATVVFVELPDITAKSSFQVAHAALLDALGFERAKQWTMRFVTTHPADADTQIQELTQSGDVATAFAALLAPGEGGRIAWDWLRGLSLSAADARLVGLPPALTQSNHLVRVLEMLGRMSKEADARLLVFMLDEATKLDSVSNQDAVNHWINAMKLLADQQTKEVGFIVSGSWLDPDEMALPLQDPQVVTRFGDSNYIPLKRLEHEEASEFIRALLSEWIDPVKRDALMAKHDKESDGEVLTTESFPFTEQGLALTAEYACRNGGVTTPRDIQQTLDDFLNRAIDDKRHIASAAYVNALITG